MGGIRVVDIVVGYETSVQPTAITPSDDADVITKGYADDTYTPYASVGANVDDITALKAVASADRYDKQIRFVSGLDLFYQFDAASTATPDNDLVVKPNAGTGRWLKVAMGGGGGSGAAGLDLLIQKTDNDRYGDITTPLDNSMSVSGKVPPFDQYIEGTLFKDYSSGGSTLPVVWNAVVHDDSSPNMDSTTDWTAVGAGTTLTASNTAGDFVLGTHALKFDKDGSATQAAIRHTRSAQDKSLASNTRMWFNIKLPSVTNLTNVYVRVYADTTSNYAEFRATTQYDGSALAVGHNTIFLNLSGTADATGGTGWTPSLLTRYLDIGVTTSSAGQTYTGICVDAVHFSYKDIAKFGSISNEFSIFDNSVINNRLFSSSNTLHDGPLTLSSTISANLAGGTAAAARTRVRRSVMRVSGNAIITDNNSSFSGSVTTEQYFRLQTALRESLSGSYDAYIDQLATQRYEITAVGGSTIDVSDPANQSANLLNTDLIDIFRPLYVSGEKRYTIVKSTALTANSSHSAGTTTLTLPVSSIAVGDIAVKRTVTQASISSVSTSTTDESFSTLTPQADPDGIQLIGAYVYQNPDYIWGHWTIGDVSASEAQRNRKGVGSTLSLTGTVNTGNAFLSGRFGGSGWSASNFYTIATADSTQISGDVADSATLIFSYWYYVSSHTGATRGFMNRFNGGGGTGWILELDSSNKFTVVTNGVANYTGSVTPTTGAWHHVAVMLKDGVANGSLVWEDGIKGAGFTSTITSSGTAFRIGNQTDTASDGPATNITIADLIIQRNGPDLTDSQVSYLYNNGNYINSTSPEILRLKYTASGQSGQKVSMRIKSQRSTTAVNPVYYGTGFIKSS